MSLQDFTYDELVFEIRRRDRQKQAEWLAQKNNAANPMGLDVHNRLAERKAMITQQAEAETARRQAQQPVKPVRVTPEATREKLLTETGINFGVNPSGREETKTASEILEAIENLSLDVHKIKRSIGR